MGGCQNYGPFLGALNIRCRIIIGIQKGTIILTTTHMTPCVFFGRPGILPDKRCTLEDCQECFKADNDVQTRERPAKKLQTSCRLKRNELSIHIKTPDIKQPIFSIQDNEMQEMGPLTPQVSNLRVL